MPFMIDHLRFRYKRTIELRIALPSSSLTTLFVIKQRNIQFRRLSVTAAMGKEKKSSKDVDLDASNVEVQQGETELSYDDKLKLVSIISKPMASKKLAKKLYKLIRKASKQKTFLRNGLKDVQTKIRKGEKGLVILAGDVTPIDVICHLPGVCEDLSIPYIYTPSRQDIGSAMGVKRGSVSVMIRDHPDYKELYDDCTEEVKKMAITTWTPGYEFV